MYLCHWGSETTMFRGVAARLNFLSLDAPDLQFPVKQCSREMATPGMGSWKGTKKVARYLLNRERVVWEFELQEARACNAKMSPA